MKKIEFENNLSSYREIFGFNLIFNVLLKFSLKNTLFFHVALVAY